jgi:nucleotide-binding universal stress UspA family protein
VPEPVPEPALAPVDGSSVRFRRHRGTLAEMSGTIVVGVDGSPVSAEALRWAAAEARLRDARLQIVHAWTFIPPTSVGDPGMLAVPSGDLVGQLDAEEASARAGLAAVVADALGPTPDVALEPTLVEGDPGDALVAASRDADLVVVGSHGKSGFRAALVGSVSRHVVDHAECAVVVVKPQPQP